MRKRSMEDQVSPSDQALRIERLRPEPRRDPWRSLLAWSGLDSRTRNVFMVRTSKGALRPRGTPPALSTVHESPSTPGELPQLSIPEEGELVNGVVKTARPQQITLA